MILVKISHLRILVTIKKKIKISKTVETITKKGTFMFYNFLGKLD